MLKRPKIGASEQSFRQHWDRFCAKLRGGSPLTAWFWRDFRRNEDEDVEACCSRRPPVRGHGDTHGGGAKPPSPLRRLRLSRVFRPVVPDQLSPQLRPGADARHLRLLRRSFDQPLLSGLGRLYRPGRPPPSLLLTSSASDRVPIELSGHLWYPLPSRA